MTFKALKQCFDKFVRNFRSIRVLSMAFPFKATFQFWFSMPHLNFGGGSHRGFMCQEISRNVAGMQLFLVDISKTAFSVDL